MPSANDLAVDSTGRHLDAAQTFTRAAIRRVEIDRIDGPADLARPANVTTQGRAPIAAALAMLDGLAIDEAGRLYVAANGAGPLWLAS